MTPPFLALLAALLGPFSTKDCSLHGFAVPNADEAELGAADDEINRWLAQGRLRVRVDRVLPLAQATVAHRLVESHAPLAGKIVLTPSTSGPRGRASRPHPVGAGPRRSNLSALEAEWRPPGCPPGVPLNVDQAAGRYNEPYEPGLPRFPL